MSEILGYVILSSAPDRASLGSRLAWGFRRLADRIEGGRSVRIAICGDIHRDDKAEAVLYARRRIAKEVARTLEQLTRLRKLDEVSE